MRLVERLSNDRQLAQYQGQFVPLKITTGTEDWGLWSRKHKAPGNAIPMIYVVRTDGELLYSGVGSMPGQELHVMLRDVTARSGVVLNDSQLAAVAAAQEELDVAGEDLAKRMEIVEKLVKKRIVGDAQRDAKCFAESFTALQTSVNELLSDNFDGSFKGFTLANRLRKSMPIEANRVRGIRNYLRALGEEPNAKMVEYAWKTAAETKIVWTSAKGDEMAGKVVSFESSDGVADHITLEKLNGKTLGPLPLNRFSTESRQLANLLFDVYRIRMAEKKTSIPDAALPTNDE